MRTRDAGFGARGPSRVTAWHVFPALIGTTHLQAVKVPHEPRDRFAGAFQLPALAVRIRRQTAIPCGLYCSVVQLDAATRRA
jgi:hypothetical protein